MKSIYCNCSAYLGEREGFDVIRCKKCGIDYIVNPKEFVGLIKDGKLSINVTSGEEFDITVKFLETLTGEEHEIFVNGNTIFHFCDISDVCLSIYDGQWTYASKDYEEFNGLKVVSYQSVKGLIENELKILEKELDR